MKILKTFVILLLIVAVFSGAMFALNLHTGPIIEAANAGAANDRLNAVMPDGKAYEEITATLTGVPANVTGVHKETSGLGYVITCTAESSYSTAPMEIIIGIAADGKICGIEIESYNDTASFDFRTKDPAYLTSYIGKDSALADIGIVAGSTYSSTAFKNAVSEAMGVLISNNMIEAGKKSDDQILTELIATVAPGYTKTEEVAASGNIAKAFKATNGTGFAYIMTEGENSYLAVVNAMGVCKMYDVEGADVTEAHSALADEAKAHAATNQKDYTDALKTKLEKMMEGATDVEAIELDTFNTVVSAASFTVDGSTYYGFYARPLTFENNPMDIYVIIDANGVIVKQDVKQMAFGHGVEYMPGIKDYVASTSQAYKDYLNQFNGITSETLTDDVLISGATVSSTAVKLATADAFASFDSMKGGVQ